MAKSIQDSKGLARKAVAPPRVQHFHIQPRLTIGPVDDPAEREAERVAEQVMRMPVHTLQRSPISIQRCGKCAKAASIAEMCPSCAAKARSSVLQREAASGAVPEVTPEVEASIGAMRGGGQPLDAATRAFMEPRFGHDFGSVRIHTDTRAARTAAAVGALAFTVGSDIAFAAGQYQPGTDAGKRLIAHELTHVVQQAVSSDKELSKKPKGSKKNIKVNLEEQNLYAFEGNTEVFKFNCVSGDEDHPTPKGEFKVIRKEHPYTSKKYHVPMNYAMFFKNTGEAIHQGLFVGPLSFFKSWGASSIGSHGCVRLSKENAATLYEWTPAHTPVSIS